MTNHFLFFKRHKFKKNEHLISRVLSLVLGLTFGILLLSEVLYYNSFDNFYPDADRIYVVHENYRADNSSSELTSDYTVSGAIGPGLKAEVPGIENATRLTTIGSQQFYTQNKNSYKAKFCLADSHLFELLPRPVIKGDPKEILKSPMNCMISDKIAKDIGGQVIGKTIELKSFPGKKLIISGIFKALPRNTFFTYDIVVALPTIKQILGWDGSTNWLGNDRYFTCVKLNKNVKPEELATSVRKMQEKHQDIKKLEQIQDGFVLKYTFEPLRKEYVRRVRNMIFILTSIAIAVLFVSLMNYSLLTINTLIKRAKTAAIQKTCGAQTHDLVKMIFSETFLIFLFSILLSALLIVAIHPLVEMLVGHPLSLMFKLSVIWPLILLLIVITFFTSYLPGIFYSRIPVATAFHNYTQNKTKWKKTLLGLQFTGASFIISLLIIISLQYHHMLSADHGYQAKNVFYGSVSGLKGNQLSTLIHELKQTAGILKVGLGSAVPIQEINGNNISLPGEKKELFNIADFYSIDANYLSILNIKINKGTPFTQKNSIEDDLLISEKGAQKLLMMTNWKDGVIGKQIRLSEHGIKGKTITGTFPDFIFPSIVNPDPRPAVFFFQPDEQFEKYLTKDPSNEFLILIKTDKGIPSGIMSEKITSAFNQFFPHQDAEIKNLEWERQHQYEAQLNFRNGMIAGNIIILIITFIGLFAYTTGEATRRQKELAIRRIHGAKFTDILRMFILSLEFVAIPCVIAGLIGTWFLGQRWMQYFSSKIPLHWPLFLICFLLLILLISITGLINYFRIANQNPVKALRYE